MKRFNALLIVFLFSQLFLFTGCQSKDNPVSPSGEVDQRLIGTWVSLDTLPGILPPYNLSVNSLTITADKKIYRNGWDLPTGQLLRMETYFPGILQTASGGVLTYTGLTRAWSLAGSYRYKFESISLILENEFQKISFKKHTLGAQVFPKITCDLSYNFLDKNYKNDSPSMITSANIRNFQGAKELYAIAQDLTLRIKLPEFHGKGSYPIQYNQAILQSFAGDITHRFVSDSVETGELVIEEYDLENKICSGRFNFSIIYDITFPNPPNIYKISAGKFTVPIVD